VSLQVADIGFGPHSMETVQVPGVEGLRDYGLHGLAGKEMIYSRESMMVRDAVAAVVDMQSLGMKYWMPDVNRVMRPGTESL